jgi:multidrug transporter EmrE-like cation transporter
MHRVLFTRTGVEALSLAALVVVFYVISYQLLVTNVKEMELAFDFRREVELRK